MNTTKLPNFGKADAPEVVAPAPTVAERLGIENSPGIRRAGFTMLRDMIQSAIAFRDDGATLDDRFCAGPLLHMAAEKAYQVDISNDSLPDDRKLAHLTELGAMLRGAAYAKDCSAGRCMLVEQAVTLSEVLISEVLCLRHRAKPFSIHTTKPKARTRPALAAGKAGAVTPETQVREAGKDGKNLMLQVGWGLATMIGAIGKIAGNIVGDTDDEEMLRVTMSRARSLNSILMDYLIEDPLTMHKAAQVILMDEDVEPAEYLSNAAEAA
ncbi:MAG: hypothetical protein V4505_25750 [Pseudomonadota bacterium]